ncbi:MAG: hypothetical protein ILA19_03700 [Bacilli bacterium]|nr:hypothetical protein [Bacilli bacterium]
MNYEKLMALKNNDIFNEDSTKTNSYELISEYFYNVLSSDKYDYKLVIDDETVKLIQIFKEIFERFECEVPDHQKFQVRGKFVKLEDIVKIKDPNGVLIVNTILDEKELDKNIDIVGKIKNNNSGFDNFGIWTHLVSDKNNRSFLDNLCENEYYKKYILHCHCALYDEVYALIHTLSQFTNGYEVLKNGEKINYELCSNNVLEGKYVNTNDLLSKLSMDNSTIIFVDIEEKLNKQHGIYSGIKEYKNESKGYKLIIPFVIIPNIKTENIYDYFNDIFKEINEEMPEESDESKLYNECVNILKRKVVQNFKNISPDYKNNLTKYKDVYLNIESIRLISNLVNDEYIDLNSLIKTASYKSLINIEEFVATLIRLNDSNKLIFKTSIDDEVKTVVKRGHEFFHIPYEYMYEEAYMFFRLYLLRFETQYEFLEEFAIRLDQKYKTDKFTEFLKMKDLTCGMSARNPNHELYRIHGINRMKNYSIKYNPKDVDSISSKMYGEETKVLRKYL